MRLLPEELQFMVNGRKKQKKSTESCVGKTVLITGGTSGVGLEAVKQFAKAKAKIILVARNKDKVEKLKQELINEYSINVETFIADFSILDDVRKVAQEINNTVERIDILINSAGLYSTKKHITQDQIELVFQVNHISIFLFTMLLLDKVKESAPSRIIQINSQGHRFNGLRVKDPNFRRRIYTGLRGYGQSKVAQLYTVYELADQLKGSGVTINAMHPGAVKTNIGQNNGWLYRMWFKYVTSLFLQDPKISGESIYYLATSKELDNVSGKFFNLTIEEKPAWHAVKRDKKGKAVWDLSMKLAGLE